MKPLSAKATAEAAQHPDYRPWYREPWVWLIIALPGITIVGCAITIWLALTRPDYRVVDEQGYQQLQSGFHAQQADGNPSAPGQDDGDG